MDLEIVHHYTSHDLIPHAIVGSLHDAVNTGHVSDYSGCLVVTEYSQIQKDVVTIGREDGLVFNRQIRFLEQPTRGIIVTGTMNLQGTDLLQGGIRHVCYFPFHTTVVRNGRLMEEGREAETNFTKPRLLISRYTRPLNRRIPVKVQINVFTSDRVGGDHTVKYMQEQYSAIVGQ